MDDEPTVLVVDDDRQLADLYAAWLRGEYDVRTAYGGRDGIEAMDDGIDVALVDRLMPRVPGEEVLERIRADDEYDCRVSIVTAVDPDFDIIEMGFDEYLVKPVQRREIEAVVGSLLTRTEYSEKLQELFALASKRAALEAKKSAYELDASESYAELNAKFERLRCDLDRTASEMSTRDLEAEMRRVSVDG
ncbi:receiver box response regulator [Natronomonas moolapensis 8.8.11]|uniref:Receiver box response regulator n=1 Tax=Natronomonas moolapensis (strain DSM 18674 / CECT 7526 / JCM 14361 / 8.8.11) TaxID=268739 RepID=M1XSK8_NATM8|nr:HalX domain-containing protein [Natronomonas moolapensis]CCQ37360.1 receiver box response regulator [Natronomonas moolapensis 8.8.11]